MMVEHMASGGIVCTNIELNLPNIARYIRRPLNALKSQYYYINPDDDIDPWAWPQGDKRSHGSRRIMLVIDEAGEWFSGVLPKNSTAQFAAWLRQTDKNGQDIYLIVQDPSILAKQGRVLAARWMYMRNMANWRIPGLGWKLPPPWNKEFHQFTFDHTGRGIPLQKKYRQISPVMFTFYDTAAMFGGSAVASLAAGNAYDKVIVGEPIKRGSWVPLVCLWFVNLVLLVGAVLL